MTIQTQARVVADSTYEGGPRLTTIELICHRFVLAELNTHRTLSRNSASSRAIPVEKQLAKIEFGAMEPLEWPSEQSGMQGGVPLEGDDLADAEGLWHATRGSTLRKVSLYLDEHPEKANRLHKSLINRLIEPWMSHTVVITATAWENFFIQRCSPLAQPEIRVAAEAIREAMAASEPQVLTDGQWHLPYIDDVTRNEVVDRSGFIGSVDGPEDFPWLGLAKISAARCARTSYLTQNGVRDISEDLRLYEGDERRPGLVTADPPHWSPLEHVATPWPDNRQKNYIAIEADTEEEIGISLDHLPKIGNLLAWRSLRTTVEAEKSVTTYR